MNVCVFKYIQIHTFYPPVWLYIYYITDDQSADLSCMHIIRVLCIVVCGLVLLLLLLLYSAYYYIIITVTSPPPSLKFILLGYQRRGRKIKPKKSFSPPYNNRCILYVFRWFLSALVTLSKPTTASCTITQCV